jgi:GntR family transcriptional regulator
VVASQRHHLYGCTNTILPGTVFRDWLLRVQIHISSTDGVAIYLQIVNQVKYLVASGRLTPGAELPPIRVLAERLLINPSTVARAYRELEAAGIVEKRRTAGTYVSDQGSPLARRERMKILAERIDALLAEARQMNISLEDVIKLVEQRNAAMQSTVNEK